MKPPFLFLLVAAGAVNFCGLVELQAQAEAPSAESILQKMEATYAAMSSYSDTITVRYRNPDGSEGAQATCKFWFVRPALFRLDGQSRRSESSPSKREVIWADGEGARSWSTASAVSARSKIQLAGSKMFGTYAYHIPTLLEASYGGPRRLHQLETPSTAGEEVFENVDCYRVRGLWLGDPYEVWIGKEDNLVRKITANYKGYGMEEIHRDVSVNQPIPKEVFQFAPENEVAPRPKK